MSIAKAEAGWVQTGVDGAHLIRPPRRMHDVYIEDVYDARRAAGIAGQDAYAARIPMPIRFRWNGGNVHPQSMKGGKGPVGGAAA